MPYIFVRCQREEGSGETFIDFEDKEDPNVRPNVITSLHAYEVVPNNNAGHLTYKVHRDIKSPDEVIAAFVELDYQAVEAIIMDEDGMLTSLHEADQDLANIMVHSNINLEKAGSAFKGTGTSIDLSNANNPVPLQEKVGERLLVDEIPDQQFRYSVNAPLYVVLNALQKCGCQFGETQIKNGNWKVWTLHK